MARRLLNALLGRRAEPAKPAPAARLPAASPRDWASALLTAAQEGDEEAAWSASAAGLAAFPESSDLRFLRFGLQLRAEDLAAAGATLREIVALDPLNAPGASICQELLAAERQRRAVLAGEAEPGALLPRPPEAEAALAAVRALARGDATEAEAALEVARAAAPVAGTLDDRPFENIRDADDVLAPVLEVLHGDDYLWLPWRQIAWVELLPQRTWLDLAWHPAHLELRSGRELRSHLPGLYAGSGARSAPLKLGIDTAWENASPAIARAFGQRRLQTERELLALHPVRLLSFTP